MVSKRFESSREKALANLGSQFQSAAARLSDWEPEADQESIVLVRRVSELSSCQGEFRDKAERSAGV